MSEANTESAPINAIDPFYAREAIVGRIAARAAREFSEKVCRLSDKDLSMLMHTIQAAIHKSENREVPEQVQQERMRQALEEIRTHSESALTCDLPSTESMDIEGAFEQINEIARAALSDENMNARLNRRRQAEVRASKTP